MPLPLWRARVGAIDCVLLPDLSVPSHNCQFTTATILQICPSGCDCGSLCRQNPSRTRSIVALVRPATIGRIDRPSLVCHGIISMSSAEDQHKPQPGALVHLNMLVNKLFARNVPRTTTSAGFAGFSSPTRQSYFNGSCKDRHNFLRSRYLQLICADFIVCSTDSRHYIWR